MIMKQFRYEPLSQASYLIACPRAKEAVIVDPIDYGLWMDPDIQEPDRVSPVIERNLGGALEFYPISHHVNDVRHDDPRCLEAIAAQPGFF